jgi:alpha-glucosidase
MWHSKLLVAGIMAVFCGSLGNAQIIYSNCFSGGAVTINGTAPTVANSYAGGSATALWNSVIGLNDPTAMLADGTVDTHQNSVLLPFTPQSGYVYTMTASVTLPSMAAGKWITLGFAANNPVNNTTPRFNDSAVNGNPWMYATAVAGSEQLYVTRTTLIANTQLLPTAGPHTLQIKLDTTAAQWITSAFVDDTPLGTNYSYSSNPTIRAAGIGQTTLTSSSGIQWNYWALSAAPLEIANQPVSAVVNAGSAFTNTVEVRASAPPFYQWYRNSSPDYAGASALANSPDGRLCGTGTNSLVFTNLQAGDTGYYYVVVTNSLGSVTSAVASLTVLTNVINNTNAPSQLTSPDGSLVLTFAVSNFDGSMNCPVYSLARNGQTLLTTSKLGLTFGSGGLLRECLVVLSETNSANDITWQPVYAERNSIRDHYNQLVVNLQEILPPYRLLQLTFRAYNEGVAFCYTIPSQTELAGATNLTEQTEFRFDADYATWATYTAQGVYSQTALSGLASGCERPLPIQLATNLYVALGEARLVDYSRMKFAPLSGQPYSLISVLDGPVTHSLPLTTPWRFIMAAESPGQLLENNFFVLNLNDPCVLTNTSWIRPGKVLREPTLKTVSGRACVDFAAKHHLSYIEFDAGWYGPEKTSLTATNPGALDLPGVIDYAASNNIGVILYVNWLAMTNELSLLPPLYHDWGVKGIKYGFVSVGPQPCTEIVNAAARICASNELMLEVHDEFRPSGYTRTYPNFMTVEGISGDETTPTTAQDTTLLFSRMLLGGADHTVCYFDSRVTNNWSYAYQLAKAVCFYSPWQYLYWYDRPTNSYSYVDGGNDMLTEVPEMEFYDYLPTVWDETRVLQGSIGQYAIIARRTGAQWFIGAMNANATRTFNVPLDFLTPGQKYIQNVYSQDPSVPTRTHVRIDRTVVDSTATLTMTLDASRGEAIRLLPADPPRIQSLAPLPGGGCGLTITGLVSLPLSLWSSPDFMLPGAHWTLLSSGLLTNSPFLWNDLLTQTQRFYRCSTP